MFSDKTLHNVQMSKAITYYLRFIDELYHMIEENIDLGKIEDKKKFERIRAKYNKISEEHGAEIKHVYYISRDEPFPNLYENADFSADTINASIKDGESKTKQILKDWNKSSNKTL
jgi:NTE family protein